MAAPFTVREIASSTLEADVYSKAFTASRSFLFAECLEHDRRCHWNLANAHAGRVEDGIGDGGGGGDVGGLADPAGVS